MRHSDNILFLDFETTGLMNDRRTVTVPDGQTDR
jgi:uncharacterized protein YprB with RNaseH-like and TPR domain